MALLTGEPRTASAQAETELICYEISKEILTPIFQESPLLGKNQRPDGEPGKIRLPKVETNACAEIGSAEETTTCNWLLQNRPEFFQHQTVVKRQQREVFALLKTLVKGRSFWYKESI